METSVLEKQATKAVDTDTTTSRISTSASWGDTPIGYSVTFKKHFDENGNLTGYKICDEMDATESNDRTSLESLLPDRVEITKNSATEETLKQQDEISRREFIDRFLNRGKRLISN